MVKRAKAPGSSGGWFAEVLRQWQDQVAPGTPLGLHMPHPLDEFFSLCATVSWGPTLAVFRADSWLCAQGSLLVGLRELSRVLGIGSRSAAYRVSALPTVPLLWPLGVDES